MHAIEWLEQWYRAQCNDEWENQHGITIETLDNPGWLVKIDLEGTALEGAHMPEAGDEKQINHQGTRGHHHWLHCKVEGNRFVGAGGPLSLLAICDVFRRWVESRASKP